MPEEMSDDQLNAELLRARQLTELCERVGYAQAATIHQMTANAIAAEQVARAEKGSTQ